MAGVSFRLEAEREALDTLARIEAATKNPRGAWHAIGAHFVFSTQQNIELQRSPAGVAWPRLSPRTANQRIGRGKSARRRGYDHILRVTNRLYQSVSYRALDTSVEWGSNLAYARIHQLGGTINMPERQGTVRLAKIRQAGGGVRTRFASKRRKTAEERVVTIGSHRVFVPARPYLGMSAYDRQRVPEIVTDYIRAEAAAS